MSQIIQTVKCPDCGVIWPEFVQEHEIEKSILVQNVCFKCGYKGKPFKPGVLGRDVIVMESPKKLEPVKVDNRKIVFTTQVDDLELTIKVGNEGFMKILSLFRDG